MSASYSKLVMVVVVLAGGAARLARSRGGEWILVPPTSVLVPQQREGELHQITRIVNGTLPTEAVGDIGVASRSRTCP
jgi:hypothetical protein